MAEAAAAASPTPDAAGEDTLVQFIILRRDLLKTMEWPVGSVVAQACHASLAVIWENRADASVAAYLSPENIASMHKVTKEVRRGATTVRRQRPSLDRPPPPRSAPQVKGEPQLLTLAEKLRAEGVALIDERLALLEQEGSVHAARAWGTLEAAAKLCTRLGDGAEAGRWNARAAKCALLALGRQSTEFERLAAAIRAK